MPRRDLGTRRRRWRARRDELLDLSPFLSRGSETPSGTHGPVLCSAAAPERGRIRTVRRAQTYALGVFDSRLDAQMRCEVVSDRSVTVSHGAQQGSVNVHFDVLPTISPSPVMPCAPGDWSWPFVGRVCNIFLFLAAFGARLKMLLTLYYWQ